MSSGVWFEHLSKTLSSNGLAAYIWDVDADIFEWRGDIGAILGTEDGQPPATSIRFNGLINPQDVPQRLSALHDILKAEGASAGRGFSTAYRIRRGNGQQIDVTESATLHKDPETGHAILCGSLRINDSAQFARAAGQEAAAVGIDRLSMFNEGFGAKFTDEIIDLTGKRLRQMIGGGGTVARIDGDVFAMFFSNAPHAEMAAVAHHLLRSFYEVPLQTAKGPIGVGISIGGVLVNRHCKDPADMLTKAEMALQTAKERGRGRYISYNEAAGESANTRLILESGDVFLSALKDNRVRLAFQPVVNSKTNDVTFHESLIRLFDDHGKMHTAGDFIPAIEKLGLARLVDRYAMRLAIEELSMFPELSLSVNVSHLTLSDPDWLRGLVASLRDRPDIAARLIIEITESAVMNDVKKTIRTTRALRDLGCRVALDDFGAGYTAFSQLKDLDISLVKIDKSFIRNIGESENHLFVRALQALADGVDIETVGEGAETMSDAKLLASDGIHHIQGYVFGYPSVERVWLPKHHTQRKFLAPGSGQKAERPDITNGELMELIRG
ncbi:MAG: GGDEF domain-containing protein [Micavibrio aeruginosavorus]|nr:GGDEF domain-containing protein [Micavibrio aeruginosavorus]